MDMVSLLISLVSGLLGGNISGSTMKENNLGTVGNSVAGLLGGGLGNVLLHALGVLGTGGTELSFSSILSNIGASGLAGAVLPLIVSHIKSYMHKE